MIVKHFDFIEFYVANLPIAKFFFMHGLGFSNDQNTSIVNIDNKVSELLSQNRIKIILSSSIDPLSELSKEVLVSGDFIKDIAFEVENIEQIIKKAISFGFKVIEPIQEIIYENMITKKASIEGFGRTKHSLIQKQFYPGNEHNIPQQMIENCGLEDIDHIAVAVENKNLQKYVEFYRDIFGLKKIFEENVITAHSGMNSVVVGNDQGLRIVLVSPVDGKGKSQISDFITNNDGEGIQHIAFLTSNIIESTINIKSKGLEFLDIDDSYYNKLDIPPSYRKSYKTDLQALKVLFDHDEYGELLQIFSKKLHTKPTWFFEIIERRGAKTFGRNNVKKLYESIERELS